MITFAVAEDNTSEAKKQNKKNIKYIQVLTSSARSLLILVNFLLIHLDIYFHIFSLYLSHSVSLLKFKFKTT